MLKFVEKFIMKRPQLLPKHCLNINTMSISWNLRPSREGLCL